MTTWAILIPTIPRRAGRFEVLARELVRQIGQAPLVRSRASIVRVFAWLNEGVPSLPRIRDRMVEYADELGWEYVSFVDDDDMIFPGYVERITDALAARPDKVGFRVHMTQNGLPMYGGGVVHNLAYGQWGFNPQTRTLYRDLTHIDPIRTNLARKGRFSAARRYEAEDRQWVDQVRPFVESEEYIDEELYHYDWRPELSAWQHKNAVNLGRPVVPQRPSLDSFNLAWMPESL